MGDEISLWGLRHTTSPYFIPLYNVSHRHLHLCGGAGSGKSHFCAQKILARIIIGISKGIKHRFLCLRKTQPAVRKSVYTLLCDKLTYWGWMGKIAFARDSDMRITFPAYKSEIICTGLDDSDKLKSIERITGIWIEEATEFTRDDIMQVNLRLRGELGCYKQIIYSYNPNDITHFFYKDIYSKLPDDFRCGEVGPSQYVHISNVNDNIFIEQEYKDEIAKLAEEDWEYYTIYGLGKWGKIKNLVYTNWEIVNDEKWPVEFDDECYGLDFGFNNPTALVKIGIKDQEPWIEEIIYKTHITNSELISMMKEYIVNTDAIIWADSAEPSRIDEIQSAGFDCRAAEEAKKPGGVKARIDFCRTRKIHVKSSSSNIIKELQAYKWKCDKNGVPVEKDVPLKYMDHAMNAFEYGYFEQARCQFTPSVFTLLKAG